MPTPNECWMDLHRLAASLSAEGRTRQERMENLSDEFSAMPLTVRRELLDELRFLVAELSELHPIISDAVASSESKKWRVGQMA